MRNVLSRRPVECAGQRFRANNSSDRSDGEDVGSRTRSVCSHLSACSDVVLGHSGVSPTL